MRVRARRGRRSFGGGGRESNRQRSCDLSPVLKTGRATLSLLLDVSQHLAKALVEDYLLPSSRRSHFVPSSTISHSQTDT